MVAIAQSKPGAIAVNIAVVVLLFVSLFALRKYKLNPVLVMVLTGIVGLVVY